MRLSWKLILADGREWTSALGTPIPDGYIQVIIYRDESGRRNLIHGHDYYWLESGIWYGGDITSLVIHLIHNAANISCVRSGYTIKTSFFQKLLKRAGSDPDFD